MRSFLKNTLLFSLFSLAAIVAIVSVYIKIQNIDLKFIPPPRFANNISFNDKMVFANHKVADHISIGSSLALCNIHSRTITSTLGSDNYLNLGTWGFNIGDSFTMLKKYAEINMPKTVILSSSLVDFGNQKVFFNADEIHTILTSNFPGRFYFKYPEFRYYLSFSNHYKKIKTSDKEYDSLVYDEYGAVCYADKMDVFDQAIWDDTKVDEPLDNMNYAGLDSISNFAKKHNIRFVFFQSPFREGITNKIDQEKIKTHTSIVAGIVQKYGHTFIDSNEKSWADSLYVDATHFTWTGAKLYTEFCIDKMNTLENTDADQLGTLIIKNK
ncbi:MAG: hypothetical protein K9H64_09315 [Bacteroidales bacterium]|nr:hypothetical protein [Bacteroidales bacterium]MCF8456064.1 hypothetical protein [Bacteroidales bacterium]